MLLTVRRITGTRQRNYHVTSSLFDMVENHPVESKTRRRRKRHNFDVSADGPTLKDFQDRFQIRSLYRRFVRLVYLTSNRTEFITQIKHEFRIPTTDRWQTSKAITEGNRKFQELEHMIKTNSPRDKNIQKSPWPWQKEKVSPPPAHFPPKSNL